MSVLHNSPYPFTVTSYVLPASTKENIDFLQGKTEEICLLCFEPSLPNLSDLTSFQGKWHIHLPFLMPEDFYENPQHYMDTAVEYNAETKWDDCWELAKSTADIEVFAKSCIRICEHCKILKPHTYVLHLPYNHTKNAHKFLEHFLCTWQKYLPLELLCLENVSTASYFDYEKILTSYPCSLCFDIAHALTYEQTDCLDNPAFMQKVRVIHWSAPYEENKEEKGKDRHLALIHLKKQKDYCIKVMNKTKNNRVTHVLELFAWEQVEQSTDFFMEILAHSSKS